MSTVGSKDVLLGSDSNTQEIYELKLKKAQYTLAYWVFFMFSILFFHSVFKILLR